MKINNYIKIALTFFCISMSLVAVSESQIRLHSVSVKSMGNDINTDSDELSPSVTDDGQVMVFHKRPRNSTNSDIYISRLIKGQWSLPKPVSEINTSFKDEDPFITPDGTAIYFASNRTGAVGSINTDQKNDACDIFISYFKGGRWTLPEPVKGDVNTNKDETSPSLGRDGQTLYYTQWSGTSRDKSHVMMATLFNGEFKYVRQMPVPVNSGNINYRPIPSIDKPGFYFSSDRAKGYGGQDLYFVHYKAGKIMDIINLGSNINSKHDEVSLAEIDGQVIVSSNIPGGKGGFDLYTIRLPKKITSLTATGFIVHLKDKDTGEGVSLKLEVDLVYPDTMNKDSESYPMESDLTGRMHIDVDKDYKAMVLKYAGGEYKPFIREYSFAHRKMQNITIPVELEIIQKEEPQQEEQQKVPEEEQAKLIVKDFHPGFVFPKVFFALNSAEIKIKYIPQLHSVIDYLRLHNYVRIRIIGYADRRGEHYSNIELSLRRAIKVRDYLLSVGIDDSRLEVAGKGYHEPYFNNYGEEYDYYNRRVEFMVIQ